ncbi:hypothetical protein [Catellatospora sp. IY07-71]|uniref:hypothetical protein n=1 Tax=Catellatospora sp. IY07-71 TaxID=2728827 RepID=UPI001BB32E68|nr:hypothetical protein [Catellatospora sp. IY07-71]
MLITSITDPHGARAGEPADNYHRRCEQETGNDQLKTHLHGPGKVLNQGGRDLTS